MLPEKLSREDYIAYLVKKLGGDDLQSRDELLNLVGDVAKAVNGTRTNKFSPMDPPTNPTK